MAPEDLALDGSRKNVGISPDGSQLVYKTRSFSSGARLVLRPVGALEGSTVGGSDNGGTRSSGPKGIRTSCTRAAASGGMSLTTAWLV